MLCQIASDSENSNNEDSWMWKLNSSRLYEVHSLYGLFILEACNKLTLVEKGPLAWTLVPAAIWAGTKGPATSPQNRLAAREALVPARNEPLVPVCVSNRD
jgi:hypothetical protein